MVDEAGWTVGIITTIDILKAVAGQVGTATGPGQVGSALFRLELVDPASDGLGHR
ncbi:hypothetical protein Aph01nite_69670 [Acrocarpospora phusangensis]|uniref:Uncharacterized protein n=1 Tax=Acrocarpospora phusangensis TaxID=1070424 RepID=A0A919QGR8_9ACTN|nr:hypothetical protein [Acrocarpospora phusangensis]GIH28657.1 hypothetical protein Aph01nite_69670 [Acrocarpospora phusangensis]